MKPMDGYDYLATAAHFDAELFRGKNYNTCTTVDFTGRMTVGYYIDPENKEMKVRT
jgi:hypothetical protein